METKERLTGTGVAALAGFYEALERAIEQMPDEKDAYYAGVNHNSWFDCIVRMNSLLDHTRASLVKYMPCSACGGSGGWLDNGPQEGCSEFAESISVECSTCAGRGWVN